MKNKNFIALGNKILPRLLSLISLEDENGAILLSKRKKIIKSRGVQGIEYQPAYPVDPRINFMKQILKIILAQDNLNTCLLLPFAFRLKSLKDWLVKTGSANILSQMSWNCRANCVFCFQKGNPSLLRFKKRITKEEIKTRLKYFNFKRDLGLVGEGNPETDEILNNPYITEILKELRGKERNKLLAITTNGTSLTPQMVKTLAKAKPLALIFSLNSAKAEIRKHLMNDPCPEVAISSLPLLKKHKIPFTVGIVVWPDIPFSDIEKTIRYAEENDAYMVRLALPGYSKLFSKNKLFDAKAHWTKTVKHFHPLLKDCSIPILIVPHMFVENLTYKNLDLPRVVGAIKNSPAYDCGIKPHDLIKEINDQPIDSIEEAINALRRGLGHTINVKIGRGKSAFELRMRDKQRGRYPYCLTELRRNTPFGFLLTERYFFHDDIKDIGRYITIYDAKNVLVLTSVIARPFVKHLLNKYNISKMTGANIRLIVAKNHFFGGSINAGDLLIVEDFIKCIKQNIKTSKPDLIILPSSPFLNWGLDIIGRVNLDIEREVGIPVEFISNNTDRLLY